MPSMVVSTAGENDLLLAILSTDPASGGLEMTISNETWKIDREIPSAADNAIALITEMIDQPR